MFMFVYVTPTYVRFNNRASIASCPITETSWNRQLDCNVDTSVIYYSHDCDEG